MPTSKAGNSMLRFGFQPSSTVAYIFSQSLFAGSFYHLSPAGGVIFGILYYRSKTLLAPILAHILLNLYYTLPLLLSVFK